MLLRRTPWLLALAALLVSCASYTRRTEGALRAFQGGHFASALASFADEEEVGSTFLAGAEAGTVALVAGEWDAALEQLHRAADFAEEAELRSLSGEVANQAVTWALNDAQRPYQGEGFERVYVHTALAMAYLARGAVDAVYVEARRGNLLLEAEEELYDTRYAAGGWGHLISALAYELIGEWDQAYVDYVRMAEKEVGTELAGPELVRLATLLRRDEDLERWVERFGAVPAPDPDAAQVVVLAGVGLGPTKVEGNLWIPTPDGVIPVSGVRYQAHPSAVSRLRLRAGGRVEETVVIEDVTRVAAENLEDRQVWQFLKSAARGVLKRELTKELEREYGDAGRVAGDLFAVLTERADTRHWRTLPDTWQALKLRVPPGVHDLRLEAIGGEAHDLGRFALEPGETMLILARTLGPRLYAHPIGGDPVDDLP